MVHPENHYQPPLPRGKDRGGSVLSARLDADVGEMYAKRVENKGDKDLFEDEEGIDEKKLLNLGRSKKDSKSIQCNNQPS